jgi:hypothetical protein
MKRLVATGLAASLLVGSAIPALAAGDTLQNLDDALRQEQNQPSLSSPPSEGSDLLDALLPDETTVQTEIDLEAGLTLEERLDQYITQTKAESASAPKDVMPLVRLGLAYEVGARADEARSAFEQAIMVEPAANAVYDHLAKLYAQSAPGIVVFVGGQAVAFDVKPVIVNGRTLVPIRAVAERLGAQVAWNAATSTATITLGGRKLEITKDAPFALVDGVKVNLDAAATIMDGRTLLPLRFVSENLNQVVTYHPSGIAGSAVIEIVRP